MSSLNFIGQFQQTRMNDKIKLSVRDGHIDLRCRKGFLLEIKIQTIKIVLMFIFNFFKHFLSTNIPRFEHSQYLSVL